VTLVEASRDGGTNALCLSPPGAIGCHFGPDSAQRHLEAARARGVPAAAVAVAGFARDVDTVDDVRWLCGSPSPGAARRWLGESGVCARLRRDGT
jgi:2-phospho-L-lactate guanylyltransferase (CobY/MobA/RfbA family)